MKLNENVNIKYRVVYNNNTLLESVPKSVADNFVSTLAKNVQENVSIIPITDDGLQVLLG
jgi:hypothetical protein